MSNAKEFTLIKSREVSSIYGYIHSENSDGTYNVCFNTKTFFPSSKSLFRYTKEHLDTYYTPDGTVKFISE